jgi:hypothetical protein
MAQAECEGDWHFEPDSPERAAYRAAIAQSRAAYDAATELSRAIRSSFLRELPSLEASLREEHAA